GCGPGVERKTHSRPPTDAIPRLNSIEFRNKPQQQESLQGSDPWLKGNSLAPLLLNRSSKLWVCPLLAEKRESSTRLWPSIWEAGAPKRCTCNAKENASICSAMRSWMLLRRRKHYLQRP